MIHLLQPRTAVTGAQRDAVLVVRCLGTSQHSAEIDGKPLVLSGNGEIFIDTTDSSGHRVTPHFLPYPGQKYGGLATTTTADAAPMLDWIPTLNWIYVDAQSQQFKYGVKEDADSNLGGPFDCGTGNQHLTFQSWEGFCAVEVQSGMWAIYFDISDDGLRGRVPSGVRIMDVELERRYVRKDLLPGRAYINLEMEGVGDEREEESTFTSSDGLGAGHSLQTATAMVCTRVERTEKFVKEELILTIPGPSIHDDRLPVEAQLLETVYENELHEEATDLPHSKATYDVTRFELATICEEDFIETPTPDPGVIDKLEADVMAMLGLDSNDAERSNTPNSDTTADSDSSASLQTRTSSPPEFASKPLPPLPPEAFSLDDHASKSGKAYSPEPQSPNSRSDNAIALIHSPTIHRGAPGCMRDTSTIPQTTVRYRPSRVTLDPNELSAIEDLSRSLDFGDRPLSLSLSAYTNIWSGSPKEPAMKRFLHKVSAGNKKMYRGAKNIGPHVLRFRRQGFGGFHGGELRELDKAAKRRRST